MLRRTKMHWHVCTAAATFSICLLVLHGLIGIPDGHSARFNQPWFEAFHRAFWSGDLYPRFLSDLWFGTGGLDFYFYGPLPFWFASIAGELTCFGCSAQIMFSLAGAWMIILSGLSFLVFSRRFFTLPWAGLGGIIYALLPYHYLTNWFSRQAIGEVAAMMILPLLALATIRLVEERKGGRLFAVSYAGLAYAHLPSLLIVTHLLGALLLWYLWREKDWIKRREMALRFGMWGLLGVGLSALYWMPALALIHTVSPEMLSNAYADPTRWLLLDGQPEINPNTSALFKLYLLTCLTLSVSAFFALTPKERTSSLGVWIFGSSLFVIFMMGVFSYPIWKFWILSKVQFPWRTLIIADLAIALASVVIIKALAASSRPAIARRPSGLALAAGILLTVSYGMHAPRTIDSIKDGLAKPDQTHWVGAPEYLPPAFFANARAQYRAEVRPEQSLDDRYDLLFEKIRLATVTATTALQKDAPGAVLRMQSNGRARMHVSLRRAQTVRIPLAAWENWRARSSDGTPLPLSRDPELGILILDLPAGQSTVDFYLANSTIERIASALTLLSLLLIILSFLARFPRIERFCRRVGVVQTEMQKAQLS